jgi:riboflavin biosynthesis pyrimidine reductase
MKPKIICQMTSTIDGRMLVKRWSKPVDGGEPMDLLGVYDKIFGEFEADGWMVGRVTMEDYAKGTARPMSMPNVNLREPFIGNRADRDVAVAIDLKGKLHYDKDNANGDHVIAVLGKSVPDEYLAELQYDGVSYLLVDEGEQALSQALKILATTFSIKTLVLQGGAMINGEFLHRGLIDEINVLIYPGIDGLSGVPAIFEFHGKPDDRPAEGQALRLLKSQTLEGGVVWLRYEVKKSTAS